MDEVCFKLDRQKFVVHNFNRIRGFSSKLERPTCSWLHV